MISLEKQGTIRSAAKARTMRMFAVLVLVLGWVNGNAVGRDVEEAVRAERETLAWADNAIERNRKSDAVIVVVNEKDEPIEGATVSVEQTGHAFLFGCNIFSFDYGNEAEWQTYRARFEQLFNLATLPLYWRSYEPVRGEPNYEQTDRVTAWCARRGIAMKGHPLLWGEESGIPQWSDDQPPPDVQKQRVTDVMQRYAGTIAYWEVVNEPSHLSSVPIDPAYRWARDADPAAHLIINDYMVMGNGWPPFYNLLEHAIDTNLPFDGIGIQAHEPRQMRFPLDYVRIVLDRYAKLGKAIHITEFTPQSSGKPITGSHLHGVWDEAAQADYAQKFYRVCFAHPAVRSITWWDLSDSHPWLEGGGLLRRDGSPKPAYEALDQLINHQWKTQLEATTDVAGHIRFRGFHGPYRITITFEGKTIERDMRLGIDEENALVVKISQG